MSVLSVQNLDVTFDTRGGSLRVLDGVSFTVSEGEILGLVGESGAGKSMTGQAIIGLVEPPGRISGGEIFLQGERVDDLSEPERHRLRGKRIGMIFQDPLTSLNPLYRIGEHLVETIMTHHTLSKRDAAEKAVSLLADVGIPASRERFMSYPHELSGGMRQRVVIALALCGDPELIIADEPTTALDVSVQYQIISLIRKLCKERRMAAILITHDMGVIAEIADTVAVMYAGRVVEIGSVEQVLRNPRHPYAQGLMSAIPPLRGPRPDRLVQIPGSMPRLTEIPEGCAFGSRCQSVFDTCRVLRPEMIEMIDDHYEAGHKAACHLLT